MTEGESLLLKVADRRIASYANWTVERELTDAKILQILSDKMVSSVASKEAIGKRFGQLFSYVFQRYIKGAEALGADQKEQIVSVLVDTEQLCVSKITGKPRFEIKRALESGDINALRKEHNNLLGDETKAGELNLTYGNASDGSPLKSPLLLADLPKS
jgi:GTP cyclohydrolase III